jgi:hypothetical protein
MRSPVPSGRSFESGRSALPKRTAGRPLASTTTRPSRPRPLAAMPTVDYNNHSTRLQSIRLFNRNKKNPQTDR